VKPVQEENLLLRLLQRSSCRADALYFFLRHQPSVLVRLLGKTMQKQQSNAMGKRSPDGNSIKHEEDRLNTSEEKISATYPRDKDDDECLSDHSVAMRKAFQFCQQQYYTLPHNPQEQNGDKQRWTQCYQPAFPDALPQEPSFESGPAQIVNHGWYDVLHLVGDKSSTKQDQIPSKLIESNGQDLHDWFVVRYQLGNRPCLIQGLLEARIESFHSIVESWKTPKLVRSWFQEHCNENDTVPVRRQPQSTKLMVGIDRDGRATECETVHTSWGDWFAYLDNEEEQVEITEQSITKDYLKDWHLEQILEERVHRHSSSSQSKSKRRNLVLPLYQTPCMFDNDMLNPFLLQFAGSDYRFCYWGPKHSGTDWHSDVLNSFSWSFNVFGQKEWTFAVPPQDGDGESDNTDSFFQEAGELVFVPSTWRHRVLNVTKETLSINRNWITWTQVSKTWDCLKQEIRAIQKELHAWDDPCLGTNWEAHESMLRGCVGLDVTAFVLMIVVRLLKLIESQSNLEASSNGVCNLEIRTLSTFLNEEILGDSQLSIKERFCATFASDKLGDETVELIQKLVENCEK